MDVSELLDSLNDKQREVVAAPLQNMLVWRELARENPCFSSANCLANASRASRTAFCPSGYLYQ